RLLIRTRPGQRDAVITRLNALFAADPEAGARFVRARAFDSRMTQVHRIGHGLVGLLAIFGAIVATVSVMGTLAVSSFLVAQRTRQIGIRRALGATRGDIVVFFLVDTSIGAAAGTLLGLAGTGALYLLMRRVFPAITFEPRFAMLTGAALWAASLLASLVPALRAARVPPSVASGSL